MEYDRAGAGGSASVDRCRGQRDLQLWRAGRWEDGELCYSGGVLRGAAQGVEGDPSGVCSGNGDADRDVAVSYVQPQPDPRGAGAVLEPAGRTEINRLITARRLEK